MAEQEFLPSMVGAKKLPTVSLNSNRQGVQFFPSVVEFALFAAFY
jgi:hypothetical protein